MSKDGIRRNRIMVSTLLVIQVLLLFSVPSKADDAKVFSDDDPKFTVSHTVRFYKDGEMSYKQFLKEINRDLSISRKDTRTIAKEFQLVGDEETACAIANAIFLRRYGDDYSFGEPLSIYDDKKNNLWVVCNVIPSAEKAGVILGGFVFIVIDKETGKVEIIGEMK